MSDRPSDASGDSPSAGLVQATTPSPPSPWARRFTWISIGLAAAAFAATIWWVGPLTLWSQLVAFGWGFAAIIAVEGVVTVCDAGAIYTCLDRKAHPVGFGQVLLAQTAGRAINTVTPLASLGEATKASMLMEHTSNTAAIAAILRYNVLLQAVKFSFMAIGGPACAAVIDMQPWLATTLYLGGAISLLLLVGGAYLLWRGMLTTAVAALAKARILSAPRANAWRRKAAEIDEAIAMRGRAPRRNAHYVLAAPVAWLVASRLVACASLWVALAFAGYHAHIGALAALATAGQILSIPATLLPMGIGLTEGGQAAFLSAIGEAPALGVTSALVGRITSLFYAALGLIVITAFGRSWRARPTGTTRDAAKRSR